MIKINAGFNKKIPGVQEYSSEGVHVTLEMELPDAYLSTKQLNYLLSLAKRAQNMGPQDICNQFQISDLKELSSKQASGLIEKLKTGEAA